ncbi:MAG: hypothetical protein MMC33_006193 [Icmadophila ericetorum]|nr:hypothetical protein [Icmadophila ericetorum]
MTDVVTSPTTDLTNGKSGHVEKAQKARPEKPDEEKYKSDLAKVEKEHATAQENLNAIKAKLDLAKPLNKDSPTAKKQQELRSQLASIRQQQSGFKNSRGNVQEKIASLDAQLKSRMAEQKVARARVSFKNVEEVDREIARLEKDVDSGKMKLVDEKKALAEISGLRKQRKGFAAFEEAEKGIQDVKAQIAELKKTLDNPETKALSEQYNAVIKELDDIKAEQDEAYKSISSLRDERQKLQTEQQEKYSALREVKDQYHKARVAYKDYEQEQWRQRQERQKAERDAYAKEKRRKVADKKLEEASEPAYMDEMLTAEGLIRYFDPNTPAASKTLRGPSGMAAEAQRTIDDSAFKGTKISRKDERDDMYFMGTGGKKNKKGRKGGNDATPTPSTPTDGKFNITMGVIEELAKVNVEPPMNQSDIPAVVEKLKEKLDYWKKNQAEKTKENITKAQAEIDRLEAEAASTPAPSSSSRPSRTHDSAKKPAQKHAGVNGDADADAQLTQEKDANADVVKDMEAAKIEDAEDVKVNGS